MLSGYYTVEQVAAKWEVSQRCVQRMCSSGRIEGAQKFGNSWAIPIDSKKPLDGRHDNKIQRKK